MTKGTYWQNYRKRLKLGLSAIPTIFGLFAMIIHPALIIPFIGASVLIYNLFPSD